MREIGLLASQRKRELFFAVVIWCCINQHGCCSKRICVPFVHRITMPMKMIWWHRFWCVLCGINEPTRRLTVKPSFREGETLGILALLPVHPEMNSGIHKYGRLFNPRLSFRSWFDISVPLSPLLTWSMPFNPVTQSLVIGQHGGEKSVFLYLCLFPGFFWSCVHLTV